jgi:hypothetical protein
VRFPVWIFFGPFFFLGFFSQYFYAAPSSLSFSLPFYFSSTRPVLALCALYISVCVCVCVR